MPSKVNYMYLKAKLLLILAVLGLATFTATSIVMNVVVFPAFEIAEREEVHEELTIALNIINISVSPIESVAKDWAFWDDTYQFVQNNDSRYLETNVIPDTFKTLKVNVMLFLDQSGETVLGKCYDYTNGEENPMPEGINDMLGTLTSLVMQGGKSGI